MAAESRVQYGKLATRYAALTARAKAGDSLIPNTAYADFLRYIPVLRMRKSHAVYSTHILIPSPVTET